MREPWLLSDQQETPLAEHMTVLQTTVGALLRRRSRRKAELPPARLLKLGLGCCSLRTNWQVSTPQAMRRLPSRLWTTRVLKLQARPLVAVALLTALWVHRVQLRQSGRGLGRDGTEVPVNDVQLSDLVAKCQRMLWRGV